MIRALRTYLARKRLERMIARRRSELERRRYAKRSAASKLGWQRRKASA